jgi:DNA adenine methylase
MAGSLIPRPFLKWAGGKTQLVEELVRHMPSSFRSYFEPFAGSAALFFRLVREGRVRQAFIADRNAELMDTYVAVRDGAEDVIALLAHYPHDRDFYYHLRSLDAWTMDRPARAARMIYLNKTGYNGLYRVNREGRFNVPFGRHKSPNYCNEENLRAVSKALTDTRILCASFDVVLDQAQAGDFVYCDPPYAPLSKTAHFTAYQAGGFSGDEQVRLRDMCLGLTPRQVRVMLSNSDTELIRGLYASHPFVVTEVRANRAINCSGEKRGKISELLITNYPR